MKSHATCKDLYELIRTDRKIFIVAWITYIYVWQRFERYFSHHRAKWIDLFPLYPASSVVAELYMQNHDNRALTTFDNSPRIYERFVDDIVSVIKRENLEQFHNHMNTLHPKIQFTFEEESDPILLKI